MANTSSPDSSLRVALVYDRVAADGGAERVLHALHQAFPNAPLFTSLWNVADAPWSAKWDVRPSWLQRLPRFMRQYRWWGWIMPLVFESFSFSEFDVVISVTGESAKAVITQPHQLHISYLLTPTRYLWSHTDQVGASLPRVVRPVTKRVFSVLRAWDRVIAQRPDVIVPISELVATRCEEFYGRKAEQPVYPPCTSLPTAVSPLSIPGKDFLFTWGRHVAYKKFELTLQAAVKSQRFLIIAGEGPDTARLKKLARKIDSRGEYIEFTGRISDENLHWYLQHAQAAIFPQIEDYGISVGEAVMAGCPVIVHQKSGVSEILGKKHGILIVEESVSAIVKAIGQISGQKGQTPRDTEFVKKYNESTFIKHWQNFVRQTWRNYTPQAHLIQERKKHV